jgi:hypothetical protein
MFLASSDLETIFRNIFGSLKIDIFNSKLGKILQKNLKKNNLRPRPISFFALI